MAIDFSEAIDSSARVSLPKIVVFGVGGGGCNAVNGMIDEIKDVVFVVANTDYQVLAASKCPNKIQLGANLTNGLGAGSDPEIGAKAAEESRKEIEAILENAKMVFITVGMGGGTGSGAGPVIAAFAKAKDILTVGVVTKPFSFEKGKRMRIADEGVEKMASIVDTLIVIPNQNLYRIINEKTTLSEAFRIVDMVLLSGVRCIAELIIRPGLVNLDFADIVAIMRQGGKALMSEGEGVGQDKVRKAVETAIQHPLLECSSIKGAMGLLVNISGGSGMTLLEVSTAIEAISKEIDPNAHMKFGAVIDPELEDKIRISIVATGVNMGIKTVGQASHKEPHQQQISSIKIKQPPIKQFQAQAKSQIEYDNIYDLEEFRGKKAVQTTEKNEDSDEAQDDADGVNIQQTDLLEDVAKTVNKPEPYETYVPKRKRIIIDEEDEVKPVQTDSADGLLRKFSNMFKRQKRN
jgi:cell division protein FtsZ